jgi:HlyD family secretion protein
VLRAPINGIVIKRDVNPGQTVAVSLEAKTLFKIANDLRQMEVHGKIDEADVGELKVSQTAAFTVDAYPNRTFGGRVLQIRKSPEVVQNVVTYTAIISAKNPELLLMPGMTAQLRIAVSDSGEVLKIPNQALRFQPSGTLASNASQFGPGASARVWVIDADGQPSPIAVKIGVSDDNSSALLKGTLTEGRQVIVGVTNSQNKAGYFGIRLGF